jgi:GTPase Era involved in 16S rRNA processing
LCGETLAAVGPQAGLTRDVIEGSFETGGLVVRVLDAPGQPENESALDAAAYALARQWRAEADLTLELVPPGRAPSGEATMVVFSRADEDPAARTPGISAGDKARVALLRREIGEHFIGRLMALPEVLRIALPRALLAELSRNPDARAVLNRYVES